MTTTTVFYFYKAQAVLEPYWQKVYEHQSNVVPHVNERVHFKTACCPFDCVVVSVEHWPEINSVYVFMSEGTKELS